MSLTRTVLLRASRSPWLARQFRTRAFAQRAVRRFMPGEDVTAALDAAETFRTRGMGTVLTSLGEQVRSGDEAAAVCAEYLALLDAVRVRELPTEVSVKLTHFGLDLDAAACAERVRTLVQRAEPSGTRVWIDMEEASYVDATLDVFRHVRRQHTGVGVCLQAYLRRTPADVEALLPLAPAIRLVKGAYRETPDVAWQRRRDIDDAYHALAAHLLEHAPAGSFTVLGTHDDALIHRLGAHARARGVPASAYEVHMLYGIRPQLQHDLAGAGTRVRVLISYGENWFPWYVRRIAERPANMWFVLRNIVS